MIIAVTDRRHSRLPFLEQIDSIAKARPDMLILREKDLSDAEYKDLAEECRNICSRYNVPICVNSFADVANELNIADIQLPMPLLRKYSCECNKKKNLYVSIHSIEDLREAIAMGAKSVIYGHIFETFCKPGMEPRGIDNLKEICDASSVPVLAIGGITKDNVKKVYGCGASGICLMSSVMQTDDPRSVIDSCRI